MLKLLSVQEASQQLGITQSTIRKWVFQQTIPFIKLGRRVLIEETTIDKLINEGRREVKK